MIYSVNVDKIRRTGLLCFPRDFIDQFLSPILKFFVVLILPYLATSYLIEHIEIIETDLFGQIMSLTIAYGFAIIMIVFFSQSNKMKFVNDNDYSREEILSLINELNWETILIEEDCIISNKKLMQMIIVFDKSGFWITVVEFNHREIIYYRDSDCINQFIDTYRMK